MLSETLQIEADDLPAGSYAVGVSGGADSVALLLLLRQRAEMNLHVVHLDHETRGQASTEDAEFVRQLANRLNLPCTVAIRSQIEKELSDLPVNPEARFRAARFALFKQVVQSHHLKGVILAHHADDQAETVFHRLVRGSGPAGLGGMSSRATVNGLHVYRPLLKITRNQLRQFLSENNQPWREDVSNASDQYARNRLRKILQHCEPLTGDLLGIAAAFGKLREWESRNSPELGNTFRVDDLQNLPEILAVESARRWLVKQGSPHQELSTAVIHRLLQMVADAATPARQHFPGKILVRRRKGIISAG